MKWRAIAILVVIIILGSIGLYVIERGSALFLRPPSEERIAFVSDRSGDPNIYTMRTDGTDVIQVTDDAADDREPVWSPDAREIAAISDRHAGVYQLFVSAWNGVYTEPITVSAGTKSSPVWSEDGREIVFISAGKVYSTRRHGRHEQQYLPPPSAPYSGMIGSASPFVFADWSPGGEALLFVQDADFGREAYVIERDKTQLLEDETFSPLPINIGRSLDVAWDPSGSKIATAFINRRGENGLLIADIQTLTAKEIFLTEGDGNGAANPAWSPDGQLICYEMWMVKNGLPSQCLGIYVVEAEGGEPTVLIEGDAREPSWSPDGSQIVCAVAREDGKRDIWRVNADGSSPVNLTQGEGDNYNPAWSPSPGRR